MNQETFQKSHVPRYEFRNGGARYNLESCFWKELKTNSTASNGFLRVVDQNYVILRKSIFTLGASKVLNGMAALYSYNIVTENDKEWAIDSQTNIPAFRVRYGLIAANGRICIFGGRGPQRFSNQIQSFCSYSNVWLPVVKQVSNAPAPRIPQIFSTIKHNHIFLFGGRNESVLFGDAFVVINELWVQLFLKNKQYAQELSMLQGMSYCSIEGKIYVFGGRNAVKFSNDIFIISLDDDLKSITIQKIEGQGKLKWPHQRAYHGQERLGDNCFAVVGGVFEDKVFRDISVFNIKTNQWYLIVPFNGPLPILTPIKVAFDNHSLFIIGIERQINSERQVIIELNFNEFELVKSEICTSCVKRLQNKQKEEIHNPKKPFVSNGLIYNMALQISFPFQAIQLIIDCAQALSATQFSINSFETKSRLSYIDMRFDGIPLQRNQFASFISHSYKEDPVVLQIIDKLKLGAFRLGKTFLFVCMQGDRRRVFLLSADSLIISHYDQIYEYFAYEERITDEYVYTQEGIMHKKFILNQLESFVQKPKQMLRSIKQYGLIIFDNNVVMTTEKMYYAEMIPTGNDMRLCKNAKKVDFLKELGFQLQKDPEISLSSFISLSYLKNRLSRIQIQNKDLVTEDNCYKKQLQQMEDRKEIKKIYNGEVNIKKLKAQCELYEVTTQKYCPKAKGILIYHQGRLINRLDINFGDLFWQKFYKVKYKTTFGLWEYVGIINVLQGIELKTSQTCHKIGPIGVLIRHIKKTYLCPQGIRKLNEPEKQAINVDDELRENPRIQEHNRESGKKQKDEKMDENEGQDKECQKQKMAEEKPVEQQNDKSQPKQVQIPASTPAPAAQ